MNIVTFCDLDDKELAKKHKYHYYHSGGFEPNSADVVILDINSIFDYEENKLEILAKKSASLAIIDEASDYDAFKNFGIDSWIKREELDKLDELLDVIETKFLV